VKIQEVKQVAGKNQGGDGDMNWIAAQATTIYLCLYKNQNPHPAQPFPSSAQAIIDHHPSGINLLHPTPLSFALSQT